MKIQNGKSYFWVSNDEYFHTISCSLFLSVFFFAFSIKLRQVNRTQNGNIILCGKCVNFYRVCMYICTLHTQCLPPYTDIHWLPFLATRRAWNHEKKGNCVFCRLQNRYPVINNPLDEQKLNCFLPSRKSWRRNSYKTINSKRLNEILFGVAFFSQ